MVTRPSSRHGGGQSGSSGSAASSERWPQRGKPGAFLRTRKPPRTPCAGALAPLRLYYVIRRWICPPRSYGLRDALGILATIAFSN